MTELHEPEAFAPLCTAPYLVMDFDPAGNVQACCVNAMYPLGNVTRSSIREIWEGERARKLRRDRAGRPRLRLRRLPAPPGVRRRRPGLLVLQQLPGARARPRVAVAHGVRPPQHVQRGVHHVRRRPSSKIRTGREGRPPLAHAYDDRFFEELEEFLPHLGIAEFRGGEPFLMPEHFRIWDSLLRLDHRIPCNITTNGTILTDKVRALMEELPFSFVVSIDGSTRETLEAIRVGVSWDKLTANIPQFLDYTRERGTFFHLSTCAPSRTGASCPTSSASPRTSGCRSRCSRCSTSASASTGSPPPS
ncbi:MAG: SPASM domain-containing protein [Acidimicrobiales bacterium]